MAHSIDISLEADQDLEDIFDYTHKIHGLVQAVRYVSEFDDVFATLLSHPQLGRTRDEIRIGLRSIVKDSHIVFYRQLPDRIRIVRILHGSRDLPKYFDL